MVKEEGRCDDEENDIDAISHSPLVSTFKKLKNQSDIHLKPYQSKDWAL